MLNSLAFITEQLELSEALRAGRDTMHEPQDLPGRFGRVIRDVDRVLAAIEAPSVLAGGWAVWRHGYAGRISQDVDIVLPTDGVDDFLRISSVAGFQLLAVSEDHWPRVQHKATDITVDILPEGGRPRVASRLAPTLIRHPAQMGAYGTQLRYVSLPALVELKLAAARPRNDNDIVELVRSNQTALEELRAHLNCIHADYATKFEALVVAAAEEDSH